MKFIILKVDCNHDIWVLERGKMLPILHLSIRGMYGVGVCYFASIAPIKDILIYTILGVN
jgi:hypothetical protein